MARITTFATIVITAIENCVIKLEMPSFEILPIILPESLKLSFSNLINFGFLKYKIDTTADTICPTIVAIAAP